MTAQPPTPPKEVAQAVDDAISFLDDSHEIERAVSKTFVQRRPSLPAAVPSPAASQNSAATSASKKVGFSPNTTYHRRSEQERHSFAEGCGVAKRSPSAKCLRPLKSILKLSHAPPLTPDALDSKLSYFSPDVPGSFAKMLQSVLSQLTSQSVSNRLDAYLSFNGALQAYGDVPDASALAQKVGLLAQFLARDIAWKNSDGKLDTNIVIQALKLTNTLLFNNSVSAAFDDDFRTFLLDRSITVLESTDMPKQVVKAHVYLLAQPKLQSSTNAAFRAEKIMNALQMLEERSTGNNLIAARLVIYQRLIEQTPALMLTRARDWMEQTFHCLLSSISDIRGKAIDTLTKGGMRLGTHANAAKAICDFLETEIEEDQSYFEYFSTRMLEMLADKENGPCVPRIWSAIILYFRTRRRPLEKWPRFRAWLLVIQRCMNASDVQVRYEAALAWNKLVFTTTFECPLSPAMLSMLKMPIISGIERRGADQLSRQTRQYSLDSYNILLHYGFRPNLSANELEATWDAFVDSILIPMVRASSKGCVTAFRIIQGLMSGSGGVWNANAALLHERLKAEDLPKLEPRWVRSRLAKVLKILQPAVRSSLWLSSEANASLDAAWAALMHSISEAGAQEVKTSNDLKQALALLVGFFRQLWIGNSERPAGASFSCWLSNYVSLINTMVARIGPGHFIEDILTSTEHDAIEVAPTPSTKRSTNYRAPQSPMVIIMSPLLSFNDTCTGSETKLRASLDTLLQSFVSSRPSVLAKLKLLSRSLSLLHSTITSDSDDSKKATLLWHTFANNAVSTLAIQSAMQLQQEKNMGQSLRYALEILDAGLTCTDSVELTETIQLLYDRMQSIAKDASGDGGVVLAVTEPVSRALLTAGPAVSLSRRLRLLTHILSKAVWPRSRQVLETAQKALWGVGLAPYKAGLIEFDQVYALLVDVLRVLYNNFDHEASAEDLRASRQLFSAAVNFLEKAPLPLVLDGLRRTQDGFATWVRDERTKTAADGVSETVTSTWTALIKLVKAIPSIDSGVLKTLEPLLVAGFASPHKEVVNRSIVFWNEKFGVRDSLDYPPQLESVLRARMLDAEIDLPTFPDSNVEHVPATLPSFFEIQSQSAAKPPTSHIPQAQSVCFTAQRSPAAQANVIPTTIERRSHASENPTPRAQLRHNDSQAQFAPIDSSPLRPTDGSQHLTEHQIEIKARQSEAAQMFPEMSSSPLAQSTALPRALLRRLDFSPQPRNTEAEGELGTPTGLPDAACLVSDDMPSSPTPSSTKDASQAALGVDDAQTSEVELDEPPSSPPPSAGDEESALQRPLAELHAVGLDTAVDDTDFGKTILDEDSEGDGIGMAKPSERPTAHDELSDALSDSYLPTEQLHLEAEAAANVAETTEDQTVERIASAWHGMPHDSDIGEKNQQEVFDVNGVTRIEDSFGESMNNMNRTESQGTCRRSQKRTRSGSGAPTAKMAKHKSPLKKLISSFWSRSQQDDDDIGEEIVVASSQRSQSPASLHEQQPTVSQMQSSGRPSQPAGEPAVKSEVMPPPPKRGPGRARKSATPTPSISQNDKRDSQTSSLKRRASTFSDASVSETEASTSFVTDTPAPSKKRKGRHGKAVSQASNVPPTIETAREGRALRRTVTAVVLQRPSAEELDANDDDGDGVIVSTPQKHNAEAQSAASETRPKLTPRSILGRLRDVLTDFMGMKVSPSEAREFDDVLYEFRREVHEADRRGRNGNGK